ncbi:unnamed protein product [Enterobius vermicularis]|uniref:C-type lectin domain-containing protein n=1 Tax=Enterobius vermicularis TaxID=51028 RepID=A0A0N4UT23_ENTVE|nr:unnamed protein product [Enterobius vermicularis]
MKAVILLIVYAVTLVRGSSCPPGWEPYAGTSDRCIAAFRNESSWFDSLRNCQRYGASLVSIHNSFQNLHVATLAEKTFESCKYWIGLYNIDADKKFRWTDNSPTNYSNWLQGQPPQVSEATTVYMSLQSRFKWATTTEVAENSCFVCEITLNSSTVGTFAPPTTKRTTVAPCSQQENRDVCGESDHLGKCEQIGNSCDYHCCCTDGTYSWHCE